MISIVEASDLGKYANAEKQGRRKYSEKKLRRIRAKAINNCPAYYATANEGQYRLVCFHYMNICIPNQSSQGIFQ